MKMHTYMEVKGNNGIQRCYVALEFDGMNLILTKPKGFLEKRSHKYRLQKLGTWYRMNILVRNESVSFIRMIITNSMNVGQV